MTWEEKIEALRAIGGMVAARDNPLASHREPYRYAWTAVEGTAEEVAAASGEWIKLAARVDGYVTVNIHRDGAHCVLQLAVSRPLTGDEVARYSDKIETSFEVAAV